MNCSTLRPSARHTAITYIHRGGYTLSPHSPTRWHPSCPHPKQQSPRLLQLQWAAAQRVLPLQLRYCAHKHTHILPPAFSLYCPSQFLFSFQLYFFSSTTLLLPPPPLPSFSIRFSSASVPLLATASQLSPSAVTEWGPVLCEDSAKKEKEAGPAALV